MISGFSMNRLPLSVQQLTPLAQLRNIFETLRIYSQLTTSFEHWSRWHRPQICHQCQRRPRLICWSAAWVDDTGAHDSDNTISLHLKCFRIFASMFANTIFGFSRKLIKKLYENYEHFRENYKCWLFFKIITKRHNLSATWETKGLYFWNYFADMRFWQIFAKIFVLPKFFAFLQKV
jgi:hypothetical protein